MTILVSFISLKCEQLYQIVHVKDDLSDNLHEHQSTKVLSGGKHFITSFFVFFLNLSFSFQLHGIRVQAERRHERCDSFCYRNLCVHFHPEWLEILKFNS